MDKEREKIFAGMKLLLWLLFLSCAEVGLIIIFTQRLGASLTFFLFAASTLAGLLIQWVRWHRLKPMRGELNRLSQNYRRLMQQDQALAADFTKSDEGAAWALLTGENMLYWCATILLLLPGFLSHFLAFLFIVPTTRGMAWCLLTCSLPYYPPLSEGKNPPPKLPPPPP